jgi:hypothetical protein
MKRECEVNAQYIIKTQIRSIHLYTERNKSLI